QPAPVEPLPTGADDRLALVRAAVRRLLDRGRMADLFARLAAGGEQAVVKRDGSNIDMGGLAVDPPARPAPAAALKNLRVGPVVATSPEEFGQALAAAGVNVTAERAAVQDAWATADSLMGWLAQAPPGWQLTAEQLG